MSASHYGALALLQAGSSEGFDPWADLCGQPWLRRVLARARAAVLLDAVIVFLSDEARDDALAARLAQEGVPHRRGRASDPRSTLLDLAQEHGAQHLVHLHAAMPFVDPDRVDLHLGAMRALGVDLVDEEGSESSGAWPARGHEVFSLRALRYSLASPDGRDARHLGRHFFAGHPRSLRRAEIEPAEDARAWEALGHVAADPERVRRLWSAIDHEGDGSFPLARALRWIVREVPVH